MADPINAGTGNVFREDEDFSAGHWLSFERFYNSAASAGTGTLGLHWSHTYASSLNYVAGSTSGTGTGTVTITREDGRVSTYSLSSGTWAGEPDIPDALTEQTDSNGNPTGWTLLRVDTRSTELFNASGQLISIQDPNGFVTTLNYSTATTPTNVAPGAGFLISIVDPQQRTIQLTYNSNGLINQVIAPDGSTYAYAYDSHNELQTVTYPSGKTWTYLYDESPNNGGDTTLGLLTGILDENGSRYFSYSYNSAGQGINNQMAGGVESYAITYNSDGSADVVDPLGTSRHHTFSTLLGVPHVTGINGLCEACSNVSAWSYSFTSTPSQTTDFDGNVTTYQYDMDGMETGRTEASGTAAQRTTITAWNDTFHVPTQRVVLNASSATVAQTQWMYNGLGQVLARCDADPTVSGATSYACSNTGAVPTGVRRWTYTYCTAVGTGCPLVGLMLTATGPRTDLTQTTSYSYYASSSATNCGTPGAACYQPGDLYQITDALGHVTTLASYDGNGRITRITDANGVNTDMTYTPRGWLASRTVGGAQTSFTYTAYGAVQTITDPDGVTTTYGYDTAHRLISITDALGNAIQYTLDAAGDKTAEQIYDSSGTLHKQLTRTFNTLGQLTSVVDGLNNTVFNASASGSYDANGNLIQSSDALGIQRQLSYDALNRLTQTIDDYDGTDTLTPNTTTLVAYDALDRTTQVTDPSNLNTTYQYDGLSDQTALTSPDTGTATLTYDAAGDVSKRIDAKGVETDYNYDALNRLTGVTYPAQPSLNISYTYDQATPISGCPDNFNLGHLTSMTDASGTTSWCYTNQGDIREVSQVINNTVYLHGYAYTPGRRLEWLQYPSGFELLYGYDADGRVSTIQYLQQPGPFGSYTDSTLTPLITSVSYLPLGPVTGYTFASGGQSVTRTYDANYRLTDLVSTGLTLHFLLDAKGRIQAEGNASGANPANETYQYDPLDHLLSSTNAIGTIEQSFTYNSAGDRTSKTLAGQATETYTYNPGTHQLNSVGGQIRSVDADGNTIAMTDPNGAQIVLDYDNRNRLTTITSGGNTIANYQYNGEGQRVWRTITQPSVGQAATVYDPTGSGNLYGEYFATNYREYVYLDGIPVASATDAGEEAPALNYLYADQLGTLRAVVAPAGGLGYSWPWLNNAFGDQPTQGGDEYYLRFPGQYFDVETGLSYNGFRNYDSSTGRYIESDPLGLFAGPSTYAYADGNTLVYVDPTGLCWIYSQSTGQLTHVDSDGNTDATLNGGYAGHGDGINNPAMQNQANQGPLPQGTYTIGPMQENPIDGGKKVLHQSMRLTPSTDNEMFGRGGFLIHRDNGKHNKSASNGCIIESDANRSRISTSGDTCLKVVP